MTSLHDFCSAGYQEVRIIGKGHFGSVHLLRNVYNPSEVFVCKQVMLDSLGESERRLAEQEVYLLKNLNHRNIVRFRESVTIAPDSTIGLIMEYCEGGDLRHVIRNQSQIGQYFPESLIMSWFVQIVDGLRYLHSMRIIHRDLKTSNIFLKGNPPFRCLIGDFGVSRILDSTLGAAQTMIGTPYYLSPEVCRRDPYSYQSDMWSLGACLYEMTMLRLAFKSENLLTLVHKILNEPVEPIDQSAFSSDLHRLVESLLSKDPEDRPSAADLLRHVYVRKFIAYEPEPAPVPATSAPPRPPSLRSKQRPSRSHVIVTDHAGDDESFSTAISPDQPPSSGLLPGKLFEDTTSRFSP